MIIRTIQAAAVLIAAVALALPTAPTCADEKSSPPAKAKTGAAPLDLDKPAKKPKQPPKDPVVEWREATERKLEIARRLQQLQADFLRATAAKKPNIQEEYQDLLFEYRQIILPKLDHLAAGIYEQDPEDADAAVIVLQKAYEENDYERALEIAGNLQAARTQYQGIRKTAANIAGACQFALHRFDEARETLAAAEKAGLLDRQYGGQELLKAAGQYGELWNEEQAIREREAAAEGDDRLPRVRLKTSKGEIELELFENEAPNTVANFISLVEAGKYDGTKFHRVIPNFMAQGGDLTTRKGGEKLGYTIDCECYQDDARQHFRGSLSMALGGKNTGDSQFFLTVLPTYWLNSAGKDEGAHTVFGRVVEGQDVVDRLRRDDTLDSAEVLFKRNHEYRPKTKPVAPAEESR